MSKKILIVEDDTDILDMMAYILRDEGYDVVTAVDCAPIAEVSILKPDLILLDNRLGEGEGADTCKQLKADASTAHIPVVIVSANMQLAKLSQESHANDYLAKPFDISELVAMAKKYLP